MFFSSLSSVQVIFTNACQPDKTKQIKSLLGMQCVFLMTESCLNSINAINLIPSKVAINCDR